MHTLRNPISRDDITPEFLRPFIANLRKLCNLSGTGCTVNELPNGLSIDVPAPAETGLWAVIGEWKSPPDFTNNGYLINQDEIDPKYYQWCAGTWQNAVDGSGNPIPFETVCEIDTNANEASLLQESATNWLPGRNARCRTVINRAESGTITSRSRRGPSCGSSRVQPTQWTPGRTRRA